MVTFTCQNCNSCLKKKNVQIHLYKCKQPLLTCIDCLKDFDSRSYVSHVSCVTEGEKYGGQGFTPSSAMLKQSVWHQSVLNIAKTKNLQPATLRNIIHHASENPNCPRNKIKFINFILNSRSFNQSKAIAENAYEMILEEFNKSQKVTENNVNGKTNGEMERQGGKRKKISETEIQDEASNSTSSNQTPEKTSKKKNKKHNGEISQQNGNIENVETGHKKNKKKKKQNSVSDNQEQSENGNEDSTQSKKKKKDKKKKESINQESKADNNDDDDEQNPVNEIIDLDNSGTDEIKCVETEVEDLAKLSKKERKKLLKQKKYEAELVSIENYKKEDEEEENNEVTSAPAEETDKKQKKKKNRAEEEKIKQQKNSISEPDDKKIRLENEADDDEPEPEVQKPKKFKWDQVVMEVLRGQDDGEMSLKRLSKKVCTEYASILGEPKCWEEVLLKFNKKVTRIPGVRVFKDKAKLINES